MATRFALPKRPCDETLMKPTYLCVAVLVLAFCEPGWAGWNSTIGASNPLNWYRFDELDATAIEFSEAGTLNGTYGTGVEDATRGVPGLVGTGAQFGNQSTVFLHGADITGDWTAEFVIERVR